MTVLGGAVVDDKLEFRSSFLKFFLKLYMLLEKDDIA